MEIIAAPVEEPEEDPKEEQPEEKEPVLSDFDDSKAVMTEIDMPSNSKDNYIMTL